MKEKILSATARANRFNHDGATRSFMKHLTEGRFQGTRCLACDHIPFPPRPFCPSCGHQEVEWIELPHEGTLHAFTQQARSMRFSAPDVIGLVALDGIGLLLSHIEGKIEDLRIGQRVRVSFLQLDERLTLHQFAPIED